MLKDRSCDTCSEYLPGDECHSIKRSMAKPWPDIGWYYPPCPKEKICEHYF